VWIVTGVVAVAWPGLTVWGLAITVGVGLIVGGIGKLGDALLAGGVERLIAGVSGDAGVVIGVLALRWPAVTVFVIAVLFGIRTALFGLALVVAAFWLRGRCGSRASPVGGGCGWSEQWLRWCWRWVGSLPASRSTAPRGERSTARPRRYRPGPPGTIIRHDVIPCLAAGATTYRVLYLSPAMTANLRRSAD
jgi:hypothetical protein